MQVNIKDVRHNLETGRGRGEAQSTVLSVDEALSPRQTGMVCKFAHPLKKGGRYYVHLKDQRQLRQRTFFKGI